MSDEVKRAEHRGYSRGYTVGRRSGYDKGLADARAVPKRPPAAERAFWRDAFLAALPACIESNGWTDNEEPIYTVSERAKLAADFADEALEQCKARNK